MLRAVTGPPWFLNRASLGAVHAELLFVFVASSRVHYKEKAGRLRVVKAGVGIIAAGEMPSKRNR